VLTGIKIEHDYFSWERSLNSSSTATTADDGSFLLHPTHHTLALTTRIRGQPRHSPTPSPSPLQRDVGWFVSARRREGEREGGGKLGKVRHITRHDFGRVSFFSFPLSTIDHLTKTSILDTPMPTHHHHPFGAGQVPQPWTTTAKPHEPQLHTT
jgi:hypothetical protein